MLTALEVNVVTCTRSAVKLRRRAVVGDHRVSILRLAALWALLSCVAAAMAAGDDEFALVNLLRGQVGLGALRADPQLADAAQAHAAFLDLHREPGDVGHGVSAHAESADMQGFSGATPGERALAAGYPHRQVLENVSMGYADARSALDGLMSAIYHRLTFLNFSVDQLGVAVGEKSRVFVLGRSDLEAVCAAPPADAVMRTPVDCLGRAMRREHYDALCEALPDAALFRASHATACPDGTLLDAQFMADVCDAPPADARFRGHGRYYLVCDNERKLDARWFDRVCAGELPQALYRGSGSYYALCEPAVRVGAEWLENYCATLPESARYTESLRYRMPCAAAHELRVEFLDDLDAARLTPEPELVVWPPDGAERVPPAFFVEEPDPLPDLDVSGYPLSIQVNPARVSDVRVRRFALFRVVDGADVAVTETRLLDHDSDPNAALSPHEFALFPLQRLAWGARYRVEADLLLDGSERMLRWTFTTAGADSPLLTAATDRQRFFVDNGVTYLLYLPPGPDSTRTALSARAEYRRGTRLVMEAVDTNTLRVTVDAALCDRVRLNFDSGRVVTLIPTGCSG